jgi:hypothetical protein
MASHIGVNFWIRLWLSARSLLKDSCGHRECCRKGTRIENGPVFSRNNIEHVDEGPVDVADAVVAGCQAVQNAWDNLDPGLKQWIIEVISRVERKTESAEASKGLSESISSEQF